MHFVRIETAVFLKFFEHQGASFESRSACFLNLVLFASKIKDDLCWDENKAIINQLGFESEIENGELIINALPCVLHPDNAVNTINHLFNHINFI